MVEMDWKALLSLNHDSMSDDEKEKVYENISELDSDDMEISFGDMKALFNVAQEMLRYKGDQVQSCMQELDEMAAKQGELEAELKLNNLSRKGTPRVKEISEQILQQEREMEKNAAIIEKMNAEITSLEEQRQSLLKEREGDSDSSPDPISEMDRMKELGESLKRKNQQIKQLLLDLQALDEENKALRKKLTHVKDSLSEATTHIQDLTLTVTNLRAERKLYHEKTEEVQKVNRTLQSQIEELLEENQRQDGQLEEFSREMDQRINQWRDILAEKQREIESLKGKASEDIASHTTGQNIQPDFFTKMIREREEQILTLKNELTEATENMLKSADIISELREERQRMDSLVKNMKLGLSRESMEEENTVEKLKFQLAKSTAENEELADCLKIKEIELLEALKAVTLYESGEFGLKEALSSNKKSRQQLRVRDQHIARLVRENNQATHLLDQLQLENTVMRKKLNLSPEQAISTEGVLAKHAKRKKELAAAIKKLSVVEEQKMSLQIQLRQKDKCIGKLCSLVRGQGVRLPENFLAAILSGAQQQQAFENESFTGSALDGSGDFKRQRSTEVEDEDEHEAAVAEAMKLDNKEYAALKQNYQSIVEENQELRQGLHEMLESIKEKARLSPCEVTLVCLEKLLVVLDAGRSLSWYQPAIRLVQELHTDREALTALLREARKEILTTLDQLALESQKSTKLEEKLTEAEKIKNIPEKIDEDVKDAEERKVSDAEKWVTDHVDCDLRPDFTNMETTTESYIKPSDKLYANALQENLLHFHRQFEALYDSMIEIFTQSKQEKENWSQNEEQYKNEIQGLVVSLESVNARLDVMETLKTEADNTDSNVKNIKIPEYQSVIGEKAALERKYKYLEETLCHIRSQNVQMKSELFNLNFEALKKLKAHELEQQKLMFKIVDLKDQVRKSVPLDAFVRQGEKLDNLENKYRALLNGEQTAMDVVDCQDNVKQVEVDMLTKKYQMLEKDKEQLVNLLQKHKEMLIVSENVASDNGDLKMLSTKLSTSQMEVVSLNQKVQYLEDMNVLLNGQLEAGQDKLAAARNVVNITKTRIGNLEEENLKLQQNQAELINKVQSLLCTEDERNSDDNMKQLKKQQEESRLEIIELKDKLEIMEEQMCEIQHDRLVNDLEMNILRHQVLDLQSANDNKAIIARLSGEILVSHLHTAEMHQKREKLNKSLEREKCRRKMLESVVQEKEAQFDSYVTRNNFKISFLSGALDTMKEQYQGSIPLAVLENISNMKRETGLRLQQLQQREQLLMKREAEQEEAVHQQVISLLQRELQGSFSKCMDGGSLECPHFMDMKLKENKWHYMREDLLSKNEMLEDARCKLAGRVSVLEENLLMLTFAFGKGHTTHAARQSPFHIRRAQSVVELTDVDADDEKYQQDEEINRPTPKPRTIVKSSPTHKTSDSKMSPIEVDLNLPGSPIKVFEKQHKMSPQKKTAVIQTEPEVLKPHKSIACQINMAGKMYSEGNESLQVKEELNTLRNEYAALVAKDSEKSMKLLNLESEKAALATEITRLNQNIIEKDNLANALNKDVRVTDKREAQAAEGVVEKELESLKKLVEELEKLESEKEDRIEELKEMLKKEKSEYGKASALAQKQVIDMKMQMETLQMEHNSLKAMLTSPSHIEEYNKSMDQYRGRVLQLEEKCFLLQKDKDNSHAALMSCKSECDRWKALSSERLSTVESLSQQLETRHSEELQSVRREAEHWLSQLNSCKLQLTNNSIQLEQQRQAMKRHLSDKDTTIQKLQAASVSLKQQILNLQTVVSSADPAFDLSSIVELEEEEGEGEGEGEGGQDGGHGEEGNRRNKYQENNEWFDTVIDRLRREKQLIVKQNSLLRAQVRTLAARERNARIQLTSLKGHRLAKAGTLMHEDAGRLHKKIQALELQLSERERERSSSHSLSSSVRGRQVALWEKQKRWQEAAERWKLRYHEKCEECSRLQGSVENLRNTVHRLDKEKRQLDSRLSKHSTQVTPSSVGDTGLELLLRDKERLEEQVQQLQQRLRDQEHTPSQESLRDRVEGQQRRIAALEIAERGKEVLVREYERLLGQNSSLSRRNLQLESQLLELQVRQGEGEEGEGQAQRRTRERMEHLESYVKLLKEENSQLIARALELQVWEGSAAAGAGGLATGSTSQAKRMSDLERTVLTLRGLVSGLQAENRRLQASDGKTRKCPVQFTDKITEELRTENERNKKLLKEKNDLLDRAKLLLRKALEKERHLQSEISLLKEKIQHLES